MLKKDEVFEVLKRDVKGETTWKGTLKMLKCDVRKTEATCSQRRGLLKR